MNIPHKELLPEHYGQLGPQHLAAVDHALMMFEMHVAVLREAREAYTRQEDDA